MTDHTALIAAKKSVALAPVNEKFRILEREALSLGELVRRGEITKADAGDVLIEAGVNQGLRRTDVEHVVGLGLNGVTAIIPPTSKGGLLDGVGTAAELLERSFAPLKFVVAELLPAGLTLLAGAPKIGKSWLGLDIGLAVAAGRVTLGDRAVAQGDVLYLALEDGERRLQGRIRKLLPPGEPWPSSFHYAVDWPQAEEGAAKIEKWCESARAPRLVVVDVLEKFRRPSSDKNAYGRDYKDLEPLQKLATRREIAILLVHHTRKGAADAAVERISGTMALPGASDAWLVLQRTSSGATLVGSGRDAGDVSLAVEFNRETCRWSVLGEASEVQRASSRAKVLRFLEEQGASGATPGDVASELEITPMNAKQLLGRMAKAGEILRPGRGLYFHRGVTSVTLSPSAKTGAAAGLARDGDKVTEVTPPDWVLPLVTSLSSAAAGGKAE